MYAIIKVGGTQYKVTPDSTVTVSKLPGKKTGEEVEFPTLLVVDGSRVIVGKEAASVHVRAEISAQEKGEKINTLRYRSKSRHRRRSGLRIQVTKLKIKSVETLKTAAKTELKPVAAIVKKTKVKLPRIRSKKTPKSSFVPLSGMNTAL